MRCIDIRALVTLDPALRQKELDAALLAGGARMGLGAYDGTSIRRSPNDTSATALNWSNFDDVINWLLERDLTIILVLGSDAPKWDAYRLSLPGPPAAWVEPNRPPAAAYASMLADHNAVMARLASLRGAIGSHSWIGVQPCQESGKGGAGGPWTTSNGVYASPFDTISEGEWENETDAPGRSIMGFLEYWGDHAVVPEGIHVILPSFECDLSGWEDGTSSFGWELATLGDNIPESLAEKIDHPGFNMYVGSESAYLTAALERYSEHYWGHCEIARAEITAISWGEHDYVAMLSQLDDAVYVRSTTADNSFGFKMATRAAPVSPVTVSVRVRTRHRGFPGISGRYRNGSGGNDTVPGVEPVWGELIDFTCDWFWSDPWEFSSDDVEDWSDFYIRFFDPGNGAVLDVSCVEVLVDGEPWAIDEYFQVDGPWRARGDKWGHHKCVLTECGSTLAKLGWDNVIRPGLGWAMQGEYDLHVINLLDASGNYEVISHYVSRERSVVADSASFGLMKVDGTYTGRYRAYARASGDYSDVPPGGGSYATVSGETVTEVQT